MQSSRSLRSLDAADAAPLLQALHGRGAMKKEAVEIYSDETNIAVLRHPDRNYPGSLMQGDTLNALISDISEAIAEIEAGNYQDASEALGFIVQELTERLDHYKRVLREHGIDLPFYDSAM